MTHTRSSGSMLLPLLFLLALMPRVGLAAAVLTPEPSGLPGTSEPSPLRLGDDFLAKDLQRARAPVGLRILAEMGAGLLTGVGLGAAGAFGSYYLCDSGLFGPTSGSMSCLDPLVIGGFLGLGLGFPLGVFWGGEVTGGDGKLYGPLLGTLAGIVAGALLAVALDTYYTSVFFLAPPFMMAGSIVGYELTTRDVPMHQGPRAPLVVSSRPRLQPVLSVSSRGALLGLGGSF
jgi:hypothetical protein